MGDRGNILMYDRAWGDRPRQPIYFYSHWTGFDLPGTLQSALRRGKDRWNDGSYLARIIFCEMVDGDEKSNTGFGISMDRPDNEYKYLLVDVAEQKVRVVDPKWDDERTEKNLEKHTIKSWSFEDYCEIPVENWESLDAREHYRG